MVDCTSLDTEITYNNIMFTEEISKLKKMNRVERMINYYNGPDFTTLDERVQSAFMDYLKDIGIDEHLAAFIDVVSVDKDNRIYINWLRHIRDISKN